VFDKLNYDPNKWNLLSLFLGCGGFDLGFKLAGLRAAMGEEVMEAAFAEKRFLLKISIIMCLIQFM
jgi:DNA (cytosine-5)-methyltransferase 1